METVMNPIFRSDSHSLASSGSGGMGMYHTSITVTEMEKRQLFLRSYQFSRKQSVGQRIKRSLFRVKRLIWVNLRSAKKLVFFKLRHGFFHRRKRFIRLNHHNNHTSLCFWSPRII